MIHIKYDKSTKAHYTYTPTLAINRIIFTFIFLAIIIVDVIITPQLVYNSVLEPVVLQKFEYEIPFKEIVFKEDPKVIMVSYYLTSTYNHLQQDGANELAKIIIDCELKYNIDKSIIVGLIHKESSFIPTSVNTKSGAMGYWFKRSTINSKKRWFVKGWE